MIQAMVRYDKGSASALSLVDDVSERMLVKGFFGVSLIYS
jgi:hypothetical protein